MACPAVKQVHGQPEKHWQRSSPTGGTLLLPHQWEMAPINMSKEVITSTQCRQLILKFPMQIISPLLSFLVSFVSIFHFLVPVEKQ